MMKAYAAKRSEPVDQCLGSRGSSYGQPQITRVGTIERRVPHHRHGACSTEPFARSQRSERALARGPTELCATSVA
jgi:transposase-like protein